MFGFSVYLNQALDNDTLVYINSMKRAGFGGVFTSLHIPEDDANVLADRLAALQAACAKAELTLTADVSRTGLARMGVDFTDPAALRKLGVSFLRLDYGFTNAEIAQMSRVLPVALNASTLSADDLTALQVAGANRVNIEAWHNYYPRPETGLETSWYLAKNQWLHKQGITTMGFVPGDGQLRLPLKAGLPTLEKHRQMQPLAAALDLTQLATDRIYIGDNTVTATTSNEFGSYLHDGVLTLEVAGSMPEALRQVWHNRPDVARDVVRLEESRARQVLATAAEPAFARPAGTITVDNTEYGRYAGEIQVTKVNLPADARVNVVGRLTAKSRELLPYIGACQAVTFVPAPEHD